MSNQNNSRVFAVAGITGQVGGVLARTLLAAGKSVRAVVRSAEKGAAWARQGCEIAVAAMKTGVIPSFLEPLDKPVPMVATADIGRVAADLVQQDWTGRRIVELEGPQRVSPNDIAAAFSKLLNRPFSAQAVPRDTWASLFGSQGSANVEPRIQMLDGFNKGWICFESDEGRTQKGTVLFETVLRELIDKHT